MEHKIEDSIAKFWIEKGIRKKRNLKNAGSVLFNHTDGPAFFNSPNQHHGHIANGFGKDVKIRHEEMLGREVHNCIGADCHGLPTELAACKKLNIRSDQIPEYGVDKFNLQCTRMIYSYVPSWDNTYTSTGRSYHPDIKYFTNSKNYMESEWWGFKKIHEKGLTRKGYGVHPYSLGCQTVLSDSEAKEKFEEVMDESLYVKFPVRSDNGCFFVAWTTTPWTLPSNIALSVNPKTKYIKIKDLKNEEYYWVAESNIINMYGKKSKRGKDYEIIESKLGAELEKTEYDPPFNNLEYLREKGGFRVYCDSFVKTEEIEEQSDFETSYGQKSRIIGTGIVHTAGAHGREDFNVSLRFLTDLEIADTCFVDETGKFSSKLAKYTGMDIFDEKTTEQICQEIKDRTFKKEKIRHRVGMCDRSKTRLIYRIAEVIFIETPKLRDRMIELNDKTIWHPENIGTGRFRYGLENCPNWAVSRTRYYGNTIPWWESEKGEIIVVGSIDELEKLSGVRITDLHRDQVDKIEFKSPKTGDIMKRVPYVFDCWFDSGCAPFAEHHYPFENEKMFDERDFLSDFILEGIDQTRGWFYSLLVISTAVFDKPAAKEIVCTGIVQTEKGEKMSKRMQNYTDPALVIDKYTADGVRLYMLSSPVFRGAPLKFSDDHLKEMRNSISPLPNCVQLLVSGLDCLIEEIKFDPNLRSSEILDIWIESITAKLHEDICNAMLIFDVGSIVRQIVRYIDDLCNWYVKLIRQKIWDKDHYCIATFFRVLKNVTKIITPFAPFIAEHIYQQLLPYQKDIESVHLHKYPTDLVRNKISEQRIELFKSCIIALRVERGVQKSRFSSMKMPIKSVIALSDSEQNLDLLKSVSEFIQKEGNVIEFSTELCDMKSLCRYKVIPNRKTLGLTFKKKGMLFASELEAMTDVGDKIEHQGEIFYAGEHYNIAHELNSKLLDDKYVYLMIPNTILKISFEDSDETRSMFLHRIVFSKIQKCRKESGFKPINRVTILMEFSDKTVDKLIDLDKLENDLLFTKLIRETHPDAIKIDLIVSDTKDSKKSESEFGSVYLYPYETSK